MKCENDNIEVSHGQDPATANYYLGQYSNCPAIDEVVMKPEVGGTLNHELERRIDPGDQRGRGQVTIYVFLV
jgi:hypothetical protein